MMNEVESLDACIGHVYMRVGVFGSVGSGRKISRAILYNASTDGLLHARTLPLGVY